MNSIDATAADRLTIDVNLPPGGPLSGMAADVRAGLTSPFKELSPRYFYDERGSELFEQITELDEYYPTRCEREILQTKAVEICRAANSPASLIELGSGSARKTRVLLDAMREASCLEAYCPVDISEEITRDTAERIAAEYQGISVHGLVCDFEFDLERVPVGGPRVIALLGGTIGNFAPHQRAGFLRRIANLLGPDDRFLLGTDLVKEPAVLEAAYNDAQGVTAAFNKNVLAVLNRELGADFDLGSFEHVARWDPENLWMDIRLRSLVNQVVDFEALEMLVPFGAGEEMRTEISTKFLRPGLEGIFADAGLELTDWWTDPDGLYALSLARSTASGS
jgi:L-histidine Nalpha-methyltransferase